MPQDEKRYSLSQSKAEDSLILFTNVKIASAKDFAEKSDFSSAVGQLNEIPTIGGGNATVKNLLAQYQKGQQTTLVAGATGTTESTGKQDAINTTDGANKVSSSTTKDGNAPNYVTGVNSNVNTNTSTNGNKLATKAVTKADTNVVPKAITKDTTKVVQTPVNNTTNNLIKQRYENELASLLQDLTTAQNNKSARIYENGGWQWEADPNIVRTAQQSYDSKMSDYKIWLSTIQ